MNASKTLCIAFSAALASGCVSQPVYVQQPVQGFSSAARAQEYLECRTAIIESAKFVNYLTPRLKGCIDKRNQKSCGEAQGFLTLASSTALMPQAKMLECVERRNLGGFSIEDVRALSERGVEMSRYLSAFSKKYDW